MCEITQITEALAQKRLAAQAVSEFGNSEVLKFVSVVLMQSIFAQPLPAAPA